MICVVTTIQEPTESIRKLAATLRAVGSPLIAVGDSKGPTTFDVEGAEMFSLADQLDSSFTLASLLPTGQYSRKNLGYLLAISRGADCVYETDDDNAPADTWAPRSLHVEAQTVAPRPWLNVYRLFTDQLIWPRGFPLHRIRDLQTFRHDPETPTSTVEAPIQQGLVDNSPDVDAVWRLILDREIRFRQGASVYLPAGMWCPFDSQSTWWWPVAYPLMYLPSYCSIRTTDIWRGFVAQRCLWELDCGLVFHGPEVVQTRNVHDLMLDFQDELPGYTRNEEMIRMLHGLPLATGPDAVADNLIRCYEMLVSEAFLPGVELQLVRAWLDDLSSLK
jgi:hypothetical protein